MDEVQGVFLKADGFGRGMEVQEIAGIKAHPVAFDDWIFLVGQHTPL